MYKYFKRCFDFTLALIALLVISPLLIPLMIVLRFSGDKEVFFLQDRIGYKNQIFKCWKFATMVKGAEKIGNAEVTTVGDSRITPIGGFLRKTKINELPQLVNILKGDMSFVGPRPVLKEANFDHYQEEAKAVIYNVKPGLTGIGSIVFRDEEEILTNIQNEGKDPRQFNYDEIYPYKGKLEMWYLENQSFWVDLKILFATAWTIIFSSSQIAFSFFKGLPIQTNSLKTEFDQLQKIKVGVSFGILALVILLPLVPLPIRWDSFQFVIFAALPVFSLGYLLFFRDQNSQIQLVFSDLGWFVFLAVGFLSIFWALNVYTAFYFFFAWFGFFIWMLLFRAPSMQNVIETYLPRVFYLLTVILILHSMLFIAIMAWPNDIIVYLNDSKFDNLAELFTFPRRPIVLNDSYSWSKIFGTNANFTATFLLTLYPFILFRKSKNSLNFLFKVFAGIVTGYLIFTSGARGVMIAFLSVIFYYLFSLRAKKFMMVYSVIFIGLVFNFISEYFTGSSLLSGADISYKIMNAHAKVYLIISSIQLFFEYPFQGVGLGNWIFQVYQYDLSDIPPFNGPMEFFRVDNHNVYSRIISESGMLGFIGFVTPFVYAIYLGFTKNKNMSRFQKAAFSALIVYIITSIFYGASNFGDNYFSRIQLVAFCSLGIVTYDVTSNNNATYWVKVMLLFTSFLGLVFFVFSAYSNHKMNSFLAEYDIEKIKVHLEDYESNNLMAKTLNADALLKMARVYSDKKVYQKAEKAFAKAYHLNPYNGYVIMEYANYLKNKSNNNNVSVEIVDKLHKIQNTNVELNVFLFEKYLEDGNMEKAKEHIGYLRLAQNLRDGEKLNPIIQKMEYRVNAKE